MEKVRERVFVCEKKREREKGRREEKERRREMERCRRMGTREREGSGRARERFSLGTREPSTLGEDRWRSRGLRERERKRVSESK